jgi:glutamate-1-semialdehyde 2,1-aminomutase
MITGFRFALEGAQKYFGIVPDLCTFGKGMANGFSVAALAGKREIMSLGGIDREGMERTFLVSTTHGAEMCGMGALVKTIQVYKDLKVTDHLWEYGKGLKDGLNAIAKEFGIADKFYVEGYPCSPNYITKDKDGQASLGLRTLFSQEMIRNRVLIPWVALCYEHGPEELEATLEAGRKALKVLARGVEEGYEKYLEGPVIRPVFRRFN